MNGTAVYAQESFGYIPYTTMARATTTHPKPAESALRRGDVTVDEAVRARLSDEEREYDDAARTRLASSMLATPIVNAYIDSTYLMSARFNRLLDELDTRFDLTRRSILSCGCGAGIYEIAFARRGAAVFAYDISGGMLEIARHNARVHDVNITWFKANEYALDEQLAALDAPAFDLVFGASILHHLADPDAFRRAVAGSISPEAAAVFIEPLSTRFVERLRQSRVNRARRHRTSQERVWSQQQYKTFLASLFDTVEFHAPLNLVSGLHHALAGRRWASRLVPTPQRAMKWDERLSRVPGLSHFNWHGVFIAADPRPQRALSTQ